MAFSRSGAMSSLLVAASGFGAVVIWLIKRKRNAAIRFCTSTKSLHGKIALVTGANTGLGYSNILHLLSGIYVYNRGKQTVKELAKRGAQVILAGRNQYRLERASAEIALSLPSEHQKRLVIARSLLDLSSFKSVRNFAADVRRDHPKLDILVNNAGIMNAPFSLTEDGIESHFQVNHLSHFLLTNELEPSLRRATGRVVIVSSGYYRKMPEARFEDLHAEPSGPDNKFNPLMAYARSKLANCLHCVALARKWTSGQISGVYVVRPGFVRGTDLGRFANTILRYLATPLIWFFSKSIDQGVQTIVHCCMDDELKNGGLYDNCALESFNSLVTDANADKLWNLSVELTESGTKMDEKDNNSKLNPPKSGKGDAGQQQQQQQQGGNSQENSSEDSDFERINNPNESS